MMTTENSDADAGEVDPIVAEVVAVIDSRELIIDAGPEDGVELGMRFAILGKTTVESSRAPGGTLEVPYPKTIVKVVRFIDDRHSVGRTFRIIKGRAAKPGVLSSFVAPSLADLQGTPATPDRVETLQSDGKIASSSEKIFVGDRAQETWDDEYDDV